MGKTRYYELVDSIGTPPLRFHAIPGGIFARRVSGDWIPADDRSADFYSRSIENGGAFEIDEADVDKPTRAG